MSEITYGAAPTVDKTSVPALTAGIRQIWPKALIAFGLGLTAAWTCFLVYGLVKLVELLI